MKCLILAGGKGEKLWPLSRTNYPKQFIQVQKNHSAFQDAVARNIPFCDEFIVVTNYEYRFIVADQMRAFQGISYRCVYETIPSGTNASVVLSSMLLQSSDTIFVISSDLLVDADCDYRDCILEGKGLASEGSICIFVKKEKDEDFDHRYGYVSDISPEGSCGKYIEKPASRDLLGSDIYRNLGMIIARAGDLLQEVKNIDSAAYEMYREAFAARRSEDGSIIFDKEVLSVLPKISVEHFALEKTDKLKCVQAKFGWDELTNLEDLALLSDQDPGVCVINESRGSVVINNAENKAVVVNGIADVIVVNTDDAVYVGKRGDNSSVKGILYDNPVLAPFVKNGPTVFRQWGSYTTLERAGNYHVRKVVVRPGRTIYAHSHETRTENWIVMEGECRLTLGDEQNLRKAPFSVHIPENTLHQISNVGDTNLVFIEVAYGDCLVKEESLPRNAADIGEAELGVDSDRIIKLRPAFKDYLWGGTRLRSDYNMKCDYDKIAEAWLLSAHPDGPSAVATGKHTGLLFDQYINRVGRDILGWKCSHLQDFPLLIKMIDAADDLSVQVHPDDDFAMTNESQYGKNEMWYVIDSEEGAGLYVGFKKDVTADEVRNAIEDGTVTELLNFVPTSRGDVFFIPAGTVHAIGKGNLILEVQQSSNCTYRLYDFDRKDRYGNKRELHLDKALSVLDYHKYIPQKAESGSNVVCRCKYFESLVYELEPGKEVSVPGDGSRFEAVVCIKGEAVVTVDDASVALGAGECAFVSASESPVVLSGDASIMLCRV